MKSNFKTLLHAQSLSKFYNQPRLYTICSSQARNLKYAEIVIGVRSEYESGDTKWFGLASEYFKELSTGKIPNRQTKAFLQESAFSVPSLSGKPIIMIANATGIAPFRAFLQHKEELGKSSNFDKMTLVFGCRKREEDYIFASELEDMVAKGTLTALFEAFSRDEVILKEF